MSETTPEKNDPLHDPMAFKPEGTVKRGPGGEPIIGDAPRATAETPKFASCLIDADTPTRDLKVGDDCFRLRSITALEYQSVFSRSARANPKPTGSGGTFTVGDRYDTNSLALCTVMAALGATTKIGKEGWTLNPEVDEVSVSRLDFAVIVYLYQEHQKFFRTERFGIPESKPDNQVERPPAN